MGKKSAFYSDTEIRAIKNADKQEKKFKQGLKRVDSKQHSKRSFYKF